jgi:hypothetical protein
MKLRVRGSSLRLRLTRTEVERLAGTEGCVEDTVRFGPATSLTYRIRRGEGSAVRASLDGATIEVVVPRATLDPWASSEQVGFDAEQPVGDSAPLRIVVEKDWTCLTARAGEEDVDTFPNPNKSC